MDDLALSIAKIPNKKKGYKQKNVSGRMDSIFYYILVFFITIKYFLIIYAQQINHALEFFHNFFM